MKIFIIRRFFIICLMGIYHCIILFPAESLSQGKNHNWLIGYNVALLDTNVTATKARMHIDSNSISVIPETRKMPFRATQGNISDENGNLIIASNGCWIANATGDTMMNGSGLITGIWSSLGWCDNTSGMPFAHANVILPFPGDETKFILFHQSGTTLSFGTDLFYSLIDMTLDGGLGGVVEKNVLVLQDTLSWGFSANKHANGRDWWVVLLKDNSNLIYKVLLTPDTISSITTQILNFPYIYSNACQPTFSQDGNKFVYSTGYGGPNSWHDVRVLSFDRCTGIFDSLTYIPPMSGMGFGLAFSPNSEYLYHSSFHTIFQVDLATSSQDTVAINDGFYSPYPPFQTDFWLMYLAANGKIYVSSGNSVIDMHVINSPDSSGILCDVQQHSLHTPCFFVRSNVLHPNYYLGPVSGSVCDTLGLALEEGIHDFHFSISPNPTDGTFKISYLLPQNKEGKLDIVDVNGKIVYSMILNPWSTMQIITLPENLSSGIYSCKLSSNTITTHQKIVLIR